MKVLLNLKGKSNGISFVVAYAPTDSHKPVPAKNLFLTALGSTVAEVQKGEHLLVMMVSYAPNGRRWEGCVDDKVLDACGRDMLNDNGRRLLVFLSRKPNCVNMFFSAPKRGISYTFQSPNAGKNSYRLDYILTRQTYRRLIRNVTVRRPSVAKPESDHNFVAADIRLLGRFAPNRRMRETKGRQAIDLQQLMASPQLRGAFIERFTPLPPGTDVDGMATAFTRAMLSSATNIAPRAM